MGGITEDFSFTWYIMVPLAIIYGGTLLLIWLSRGIKLNTKLLLTILTFTAPFIGLLISLGVLIYLRKYPQKLQTAEQEVL